MSVLVYKAPPLPPTKPSVRRVYVLPHDLVERIHRYGYDKGHQSEVAIVRELLESALGSHEATASASTQLSRPLPKSRRSGEETSHGH